MKLDEVFDEHYYDYLQDEMRHKKYNPHEDSPVDDTEMHMGDFIISAYETGQISFQEAKRRLRAISSDELEYSFWNAELIITAEEKGLL